MIDTFLATLSPMLTLFICMAIGFTACKTKILPENSAKVMAKMETWIFCPALSFITMARNCTRETIGTHAINITIAAVSVMLAMGLSIFLARFFSKKKCAERGVYMYALAFANSGYVGDPLAITALMIQPERSALKSRGMKQLKESCGRISYPRKFVSKQIF